MTQTDVSLTRILVMSLSMMITQTLVLMVMMRPAMMASCDKEMIVMMHTRFGQCTAMYRQLYETALAEGGQEIGMVTCELLDNMVTVCGEVWRQCHPANMVENMRTGFVEKLILSNKDATFDIEHCDSIQKYRLVSIILSQLSVQNVGQHLRQCTHHKLSPIVLALSPVMMPLIVKMPPSIYLDHYPNIFHFQQCPAPGSDQPTKQWL